MNTGQDQLLAIGDIRLDGEFRRDSGHVVLTSSFVEIDPQLIFQHNVDPYHPS